MTTIDQPDDQTDVEQLADAIRAAVEADALATVLPNIVETAASAFPRLSIDFVRRYNRLDVVAEPATIDGPVLFVANHRFGGIFDLNVFAARAALEQLELTRPVTILTRQLEQPEEFAARVQAQIQKALTDMTRDRRPLLA